MPSRALQIAALNQLLLSIGHTITAPSFMRTAAFRTLPTNEWSKSTVGWYQGSGLFLILAVINLRWSKQATLVSLDKVAAALATALLWASGVWYHRNGDSGTAGVVAISGAVQAWAALG
ncbi:hypothetical protein BX600DRAFT_299341 [Xylariales sp. PMI_506]|nr:hypothetical protein BX600DRAFT_299341 [Xylariales sp. PMI_506]